MIQGALIAQNFLKDLMVPVACAQMSGLKCFHDGSLDRFRQRLFENRDQLEVCLKTNKIIEDSYENLRTKIYDLIQYFQNKIHY